MKLKMRMTLWSILNKFTQQGNVDCTALTLAIRSQPMSIEFIYIMPLLVSDRVEATLIAYSDNTAYRLDLVARQCRTQSAALVEYHVTRILQCYWFNRS